MGSLRIGVFFGVRPLARARALVVVLSLAVSLLSVTAPARASGAELRERLERALADYEKAQAESDLDARRAGFSRAELGFAA